MDNKNNNSIRETCQKNNGSLSEKIKNTAIFKFLIKYPRISATGGLIIFIIIIMLPLSWGEKLMIPVRAIVFGFFIAFTIYCLKIFKSTSRK